MAHFYYIFATMGASKTRELLSVDWNYRKDNKLVSLVAIPEKGVRSKDGAFKVESRDGSSRVVDFVIFENTNIFDLIVEKTKTEMVDILLVDEAQMLSKAQVYQLAKIVDELNIPVMAYGLKNDFQNNLFEGSMHLLLLADKIKEIKTICRYCKNKATMVIRFEDGKPVFKGEQIKVGGNDMYAPCCRKCYMKTKRIQMAKGYQEMGDINLSLSAEMKHLEDEIK